MKRLTFLALVFGTINLCSCSQNATPSQTPFNANTFDPRNFTFVSNSAIPFTGQMRQLGAGYDVVVKNGKVVSHLPYFGRSHTAAGVDDAGIRFTSSEFSLVPAKSSDGTHSVMIEFKDQRTISRFQFTVYRNGSADLEVTSPFRDMINFKGDIREKRTE